MVYFGFGRLELARWRLSCLTVVALLGVTDRWEGPSPGIPEGILVYWTAGYREHTLGHCLHYTQVRRERGRTIVEVLIPYSPLSKANGMHADVKDGRG